MRENSLAYPCSGFFIIDKEHGGKDNKINFDFWLPNKEEMFSFRVDGEIEILKVENFKAESFEKISTDYDFNFEDFEKMISDKMKKENIKGKIQKLLFSLQRLDGKDFLIGTLFLTSLGLLKVTISLEENKIISFEKKSFFDMIKIINGKKVNRKKKN